MNKILAVAAAVLMGTGVLCAGQAEPSVLAQVNAALSANKALTYPLVSSFDTEADYWQAVNKAAAIKQSNSQSYAAVFNAALIRITGVMDEPDYIPLNQENPANKTKTSKRKNAVKPGNNEQQFAKQMNEVVAEFSKAISLRPSVADPYVARAALKAMLLDEVFQNPGQGYGAMRKAARPHQAAVRAILRDYLQAEKLGYKGNFDLNNAIAEIYHLLGDQANAQKYDKKTQVATLAHAQEMVKAYPNNSSVWMNLANAQAALGNHEAAKKARVMAKRIDNQRQAKVKAAVRQTAKAQEDKSAKSWW